jgi:hypothetical protein
MKRSLIWLLLTLLAPAVLAAPSAVPTFESIGLYWSPPGAGEGHAAKVAFREAGTRKWRPGLDLWFDARDAEYRGSLVELRPGARYEIRLTLDSGFAETVHAATWSENFRIKRTVRIAPGTTRLVIEPSDSGDEQGYVLFTAAPGRNLIDQSGVPGNDPADSCVVVKQGVHHVIIRGLVLGNCKRYGVFIERQFSPVLDAQTHDIVIEDNEIFGWGTFEQNKPGSGLADNDGAIHCNYYRETEDGKRPDRVIIQRNTLRDPRYGSNPWHSGTPPRKHPMGPQGVLFTSCGRNHVIRDNEIYSTNGNHFMDGIGGGGNFSFAGFPWADSDINGNRISQVYDDGIEAEGANRNVRIWGNYFDRVFVAIANAATAVGPLYVWRNVSHFMAGMYQPDGDPDLEQRGPFIKAGSRHPAAVGGRAYYFHNTVLQPPGRRYSAGAGSGITNTGGALYNFVSRNNIWHIHKEAQIRGEPRFSSLRADGDQGPIDADFDLYNGPLRNAGENAQRRGWGPGPAGRPIYATSGRSYPDLAGEPGSFALSRRSPGYGVAERIPNFNDRYPRPDVGAHQSGTPSMHFGPDRKRPSL